MKVTNHLLNYDLKIVQNTKYFNYSLESVLLTKFVDISKKTQKILEIGTGNALIPLILSTMTKNQIISFEIQKKIAKLAIESVELNEKEDQILIINDDIKNISNYYKKETFDLIISNPPYFKLKSNRAKQASDEKNIAMHEHCLTLEELVSIASKYLKDKASLVFVHQSERLVEIIEVLNKQNLKIKKLQFIYSKEGKNSKRVMIEAIKNGKEAVKVMPALIIHDEEGNYKKEITEKYFGR